MSDHIDALIAGVWGDLYGELGGRPDDATTDILRAVAEAAENSGYVKGYKDGSNKKTAAEMQDARIEARRDLALEAIAYFKAKHREYGLAAATPMLVVYLREIAEEGGMTDHIDDPNYPSGEFNALKWAEHFVRLHGGDKGLMHTWFAGAIMTGHNHEITRQNHRRELARELLRSVLYEEDPHEHGPLLYHRILVSGVKKLREIAGEEE